MNWLFWSLIATILYTYFGYPIAIWLAARVRPRPVAKAAITPTLSVLLSLYNEDDVIEAKLANLLSLDYPADKMEVLIGSDGSTDNTHAVIGRFNDRRINLVINKKRRGKMATLNDLVLRATGSIIVFTDARQSFEADALRQLVANFADPKIGCVSGELVFIRKEEGTAKGVNLYWNYEKFIRRQESAVHSMLGATGAIYAIRRELFEPGPADIVLDDMFTPLMIIKKGYRATFDDSAHAFDRVAANPKEEYRRKSRTLYGNYQIFGRMPEMFNPLTSPVAIQLFSHKFLRVVAPFFLIAIGLINMALITDPFYKVIFALQCLFYAMAGLGALTRDTQNNNLKLIRKICYIPYVFCLLNFAAFAGFLKLMTGDQKVLWTKARNK